MRRHARRGTRALSFLFLCFDLVMSSSGDLKIVNIKASIPMTHDREFDELLRDINESSTSVRVYSNIIAWKLELNQDRDVHAQTPSNSKSDLSKGGGRDQRQRRRRRCRNIKCWIFYPTRAKACNVIIRRDSIQPERRNLRVSYRISG